MLVRHRPVYSSSSSERQEFIFAGLVEFDSARWPDNCGRLMVDASVSSVIIAAS